MQVHFIAIGGSAMHNLALALHHKGEQITGSDDTIFEPSRSRLDKHGLLPVDYGWFPEKIHEDLDAVILGMHAKEDNPELLKAQQLGLKIYSYPEYLFEQAKNKTTGRHRRIARQDHDHFHDTARDALSRARSGLYGGRTTGRF